MDAIVLAEEGDVRGVTDAMTMSDSSSSRDRL